MNEKATTSKPLWSGLPPLWLGLLGAWLLLSLVFASQLYWAGYVRSWRWALASESVYWLVWGPVALGVFGLCRHLYFGKRKSWRYAALLLTGMVVALLAHTALTEIFSFGISRLTGSLGPPGSPPMKFFVSFHTDAVRAAGINVPVFATLVLGWHAFAYHREMRDRHLRSLELEALLRRSELQTLRSQINPHFLFNTLHSIAELVLENPTLAEDLILKLGELLRRALRTAHTIWVPLAEEVEFARQYLEIEQVRLGERLQVVWEVDAGVLRASVPSLVLQPLVENAIRHGIAPTGKPGRLFIRGRRADASLCLQIRDNGPGLPPEERRCAGTGLRNTQARLQVLYGQTHHFELTNDGGLVVNIQIPYVETEIHSRPVGRTL